MGRPFPLLAAAATWAAAQALEVHILAVSTWSNSEGRLRQRRALQSCLPGIGEHLVDLNFLLGDFPTELHDPFMVKAVHQEIDTFGDLVLVGGGDAAASTLPMAPEHFVKHLAKENPAAVLVARGTRWLLQNRPGFDYVVHVSEGSFAHVPRLLDYIGRHANASLVLGRLSETPLLVGDPTELEDEYRHEPGMEHGRLCLQESRISPGGMDFRGCVALAKRCCPSGAADCPDLENCLRSAHLPGIDVASYYGTALSPPGVRGEGFVLGRRIADFVGENADELKMKGPVGMLLGFWVAALEDVHFVDVPAALHCAASGEPGCAEDHLFLHPAKSAAWDERSLCA